MLNIDKDEDEVKEAKRYVSLSTRLSRIDTIKFILHCKRLNTSPSERLRELTISDIKNPRKQIIAGKNIISYDKVNNSFKWIIQPDKGNPNTLFNNLPIEFLKNLQSQIQDAIQDKDQWVHQTHSDSVSIPTELLDGER